MSWQDIWAVDWPDDVDIRVANLWPSVLRRNVQMELRYLRGVSCRCQDGDCLVISCVCYAASLECEGMCSNPGCKNSRLRCRKWGVVEVYDTQVYGLGLRAKQVFNSGDLVVEYVGSVCSSADLPEKIDERRYVVDIGYGLFVDAAGIGGIARYINHSCVPNCRLLRWIVDGLPRVGVFAITEVDCGTEITVDYGIAGFGVVTGFRCECKKCRVIGDN